MLAIVKADDDCERRREPAGSVVPPKRKVVWETFNGTCTLSCPTATIRIVVRGNSNGAVLCVFGF